MKNISEWATEIWIRGRFCTERNAGLILFVFGGLLLHFGLSDLAFAQTGGDVFKDAAVNLACNVLPGRFGAMLSAFTGIFALIAAATGAYRGAWALLFVSIGCYIAKEFVAILFPSTVNC